MILKKHHNRHAYNWLIYNISERLLAKYSHLYTGTIFDLGAGEAVYKEYFLQQAVDYVAVDWTDSYHNTKANIIADLNKPLPIRSEVANTVVSLSVIEHLCEPQMMLNEAFRILKPGGSIVLQVPWQWWIHEAPYDYFRFTPFGLKYLFAKAGFSQINVEPQSGYFTTSILKWNYFTNRFVGGPKPVRWFLTALMIPFWYLGQVIAPLCDKLDRNWLLESSGYYVTAVKP